jgi:flagellar motility protein MotE (MotC chaperone)
VNKKMLLITVAVGVFGFVGAFATGWLTRPAAVMGSPPLTEANDIGPAQTSGGVSPQMLTASPTSTDDGANTRAMTEEQLKELIYEVREKIQDYNTKLNSLEKEKERLLIAQHTLKKDIDTLNNLRVDLAATVANLKSERDTLLKARVEIEQAEKANLLAIAAAYDKMDPVAAGEILTNMAVGQSQNGAMRGANIDDAVKILHFMQDRTKAKVLAELVTAEPGLAALLCQKLKQVTEGR